MFSACHRMEKWASDQPGIIFGFQSLSVLYPLPRPQMLNSITKCVIMGKKLGVAFSIVGAAMVIISISGLQSAGHDPLSSLNNIYQTTGGSQYKISQKLAGYAQLYDFKKGSSNVSNFRISGTEIQLVVTNLSFKSPDMSGYTIKALENNQLLSYLVTVLQNDGTSTTVTLIPLYSNSINTTQTANIPNYKQDAGDSSPSSIQVKTAGYPISDVQNVFSMGWLGWFLSFNEAGTYNLIQDMGSLSLLLAFLSYCIGALVVASFVAFLASLLLGLGAILISNLDLSGGDNGVYFDGAYGTLTGCGTPWTHSIPWWA